jgi:protein phosphatase
MSERPREEAPPAASPSGSDPPAGKGVSAAGERNGRDDESSSKDEPEAKGKDEPKAKDEAQAKSKSDAPPSSEGKAEGEERASKRPPPGPIKITYFGRTDVGQIREHNEDNFLVADLTSKVRGVAGGAKSVDLAPGGFLLAVCDGMGGAAAGEVASKLATDIIYDKMLSAAGHRDRDQLALDIVEALEEAGQRILEESNNNRACRGMGTTATVAALVDDHLLLGQVGDSRAYILRGERLVQATRDQSLVNQLIEAGQLTEEEAENFEHSNIILQALGTADAVQVDLTYVELRRGDVLMMCSDGLSGMIRDAEIQETLTNVPDPAEACRVLIDDANQAGGHDNITVISAVFDGEGLKDAAAEDVTALGYRKYKLPAWVDERTGKTQKIRGTGDYDSTPSIEITGEFEVDANTDWADMIDDRPQIPKEDGPNVSTVMIWIAVAAICFALYYFMARP